MRSSVLIVDDDPDFRRLARQMLDAAGLTVAGEAADAGAALAAAHASTPGGIIVDIGLPDRNGVELARELMTLAWHPRVLLTSTDADAAPVIGGGLWFVPKEDLPNAALHAFFGA